MIHSTQRGHKIEYINNKWVYADDGTTTKIQRPCIKCGRLPTKEGYDACIGHVKGAESVCCGHGATNKIIR
ncbi:MAG: hypothetical protein KAS32_15720 [Candidatus Peribacteraceae bacterium]|nr:hypothetical protein [Candidatus Peribacteraceae bacterium]